VVGGVAWLAYAGGGSWVWPALAVACLLGATAPFFCPSRYRLTAEEIEITGWLPAVRRPLAHFRSFDRSGDQARLCTFAAPHWLDRFRAVKIYLPDDAEAVLSFLEEQGIVRRK